MPTVLLVDDRRVLLDLGQAVLATAAVRVLTAGSGLAALSLLQRESPDAAVIDLDMPLMDGIETMRRVRKLQNCAEMIVLLAAPASRRLECLAAGADGVILKPLAANALLNELGKFIPIRQRLQIRVTAHLPAEFHCAGRIFTGETKNLSLGGAFIRGPAHPPLGAHGELVLHSSDREFRVPAEAARILPDAGYALRFTGGDGETLAALADELEARLIHLVRS